MSVRIFWNSTQDTELLRAIARYIIAVAFVSTLFGVKWASMERAAIQQQAVDRGYGEWAVGPKRTVEFRWIERKPASEPTEFEFTPLSDEERLRLHRLGPGLL